MDRWNGWHRAVPDAEPRILVVNGDRRLRNDGDLGTLEASTGRLCGRWPQSGIGVLTSAVTSNSWMPRRQRTPGIRTRFRRAALPGAGSMSWRAADGLRSGHGLLPAGAGLEKAVRRSSLVLAAGGGYVTDVDPEEVASTLDVLAMAIDHGIPTAMVGQGLGPLTDARLVAQAARILPRVDVIGLREQRLGPALLASLGVAPERIVVTGDDAVELARRARQRRIGADIGVCLRSTDYGQTAARAPEVVGQAVRSLADKMGAALVPLIISEYRSARRFTLPLVAGYTRVVPPLGRAASARAVAARVSRCRVLVTSAYHLAVYALAQGIPVVGLSSSLYYDDKFLGLDDMFGGGVQLVRLDDPQLPDRLRVALRDSWRRAPALHGPLQVMAEMQIRSGQEFYERIFGLVESIDRSPATISAITTPSQVARDDALCPISGTTEYQLTVDHNVASHLA